MSLRQKVDALNQQILDGDILGAFEKYYADDVVMSDNNQDHRRGKDRNREHEKQFVGGITAFHGAEIKSSAVHETGEGSGTAFTEWFMHFDHSAYGNDTRLEQVAVQEWKDGQIVKETFYHA
ncbi:MAG: nuclear transport factor 2 family protein [Rhodothermales bacterium]